MSGPLLVLFGVTPANAPHAPELPTVYIETSVSEHFLSNSHSVFHMLLITMKHLDMNAIVLGKHGRRPSVKTKSSSLWELKKRDEL